MFPQVKSQHSVFQILIAFSMSLPGSCPLSACRQSLQPCWAGRGAGPGRSCSFKAQQHRNSTKTLMSLLGLWCCFHQTQSLRESLKNFSRNQS